MRRILTIAILLTISGCATKPTVSNNNPSANSNTGVTTTKESAGSQPAAAKALGDLKEGEASGSILVEGETINLKYAYAGHGQMFKEDAVLLLVTDTPVAPEDLAKHFTEYGEFPKGARGLEYKVGTGFWVMYHPGSFQTSGINTLKDYSVENGIVRGRDEDKDDFDGKVYKRSLSFVARLPEKKP